MVSFPPCAWQPWGSRASASLGPPVARAATLTTPILETCVRVRTCILSAAFPGRWRRPRWRRRRARNCSQAGVSFGAVHTLGMPEASSSVVEAGGSDRARWLGLRCWMVWPADARLGPPSQLRRQAGLRSGMPVSRRDGAANVVARLSPPGGFRRRVVRRRVARAPGPA